MKPTNDNFIVFSVDVMVFCVVQHLLDQFEFKFSIEPLRSFSPDSTLLYLLPEEDVGELQVGDVKDREVAADQLKYL